MNKSEFLRQFHHIKLVNKEPDFSLKNAGKPAAVLIPIVQYQNELKVVFTVRAKHLKHHGGQISFPGGKQEQTDKTLIQTALRETYEEIGIPPEKVDIVGNLPIYRTISGYEVSPYIGFLPGPLNLVLDKNEVEETFEVPLTFLLDHQNHLIHWVKRRNDQTPIYFIPWQQHNIWGATAAFVRNLSHHFYGNK
ncbi:CoA pyrophosphatase [Paraglaciecola marina]|uniref:CoA pyrophosphatase n=1 Tax=Paraglaciecola marina TaxID=2500157 RepID=UPI00105F3E7D|nr:CoA pyrophosphatase [Paraglaciecola marina]